MYHALGRDRQLASLQLRFLLPRDLPAVCEIEERSFPEFERWGPNDFKRFLERQELGAAVIIDDQARVLGYLAFRVYRCGRQLLRLVVHPAWRRRGIGRASLSRFIIDQSTPGQGVAAVVHERRVGVQLFFRACGWRWVRTLKGKFAPDDGYRFELGTAENTNG